MYVGAKIVGFSWEEWENEEYWLKESEIGASIKDWISKKGT